MLAGWGAGARGIMALTCTYTRLDALTSDNSERSLRVTSAGPEFGALVFTVRLASLTTLIAIVRRDRLSFPDRHVHRLDGEARSHRGRAGAGVGGVG
jgi:hypothetical protein